MIESHFLAARSHRIARAAGTQSITDACSLDDTPPVLEEFARAVRAPGWRAMNEAESWRAQGSNRASGG
jgi:hypothetical protein